jgi:tyrosyl-tRNA synthetase
MTQLLDRDFVKNRIGEGGDGISYAEFSYSLIQGYDFLHLYRNKQATLQLAGADQWGNSITGVQLIRRLEGAEAHVFTAPLVVNKQTGVKFGKSEDGAIWLDPARTSPYKFYQFWLNIDDETAEDLIKIYTLLGREEVETLIAAHKENLGARGLQTRLAREVTAIVHGHDRTRSVENVTKVLFGGASVQELNDEELNDLAAEIPSVNAGDLVEILVKSGHAASNGDARRLIDGGAINVNGEKVDSTMDVKGHSLVKKGKNGFILVR